MKKKGSNPEDARGEGGRSGDDHGLDTKMRKVRIKGGERPGPDLKRPRGKGRKKGTPLLLMKALTMFEPSVSLTWGLVSREG